MVFYLLRSDAVINTPILHKKKPQIGGEVKKTLWVFFFLCRGNKMCGLLTLYTLTKCTQYKKLLNYMKTIYNC